MTFLFVLALAVPAFGFVMYPLFKSGVSVTVPTPSADRLVYLNARLDEIGQSIDDLELNLESGALARQEYERLKTVYVADRARIQEEFESLTSSNAVGDDVEREVRQFRKRNRGESFSVTQLFCKYCGAKADKVDRFCARCGEKIQTRK